MARHQKADNGGWGGVLVVLWWGWGWWGGGMGGIWKGNCLNKMTSSNGNVFRVTGHCCGEFTGDWWIPSTKASDAKLCCFLRSAPEERLIKQWLGWWLRRNRTHYDVTAMMPKISSCHVVTGGTRRHNDNIQRHQWRCKCHHDNSRFSMKHTVKPLV